MMSPLSTFRRAGGSLVCPGGIELCRRMDGRVGVFSRSQLSATTKSRVFLTLPVSSAITTANHRFHQSPLWTHISSLVATINTPWYFEVTGETACETKDEHLQQLNRVSASLKEHKWVESATALYVASFLVRSSKQVSPLEKLLAWTYCPENHQALSPLGNEAASLDEVQARFRVFQMRALLEASLMDAVTTATPQAQAALFGPGLFNPVLLGDPIVRGVEIATSGAVLNVPVEDRDGKRRGLRKSVFAPFLSSVASAAAAHESPNCVIVMKSAPRPHLALQLTRSVRAGEELLRSILVLLLLLSTFVGLTTSPSRVSAFKLPANALSSVLYHKMFNNAPAYGAGVDYCVTLSNERFPFRQGIAGCITPNFVQSTRLEYIDADVWIAAANQSMDDNYAAATTAAILAPTLIPTLATSDATSHIALVVPARKFVDARFSCSFVLDVVLQLQQTPHSLTIAALLFPDTARLGEVDSEVAKQSVEERRSFCAFEGLADPSPLASTSPYNPSVVVDGSSKPHDWFVSGGSSYFKNNVNAVYRNSSLPGLLWRPMNLTLLFIGDFAGDVDEAGAAAFWKSAHKKSAFNSGMVSSSSSSGSKRAPPTQFVLQTNNAMSFLNQNIPARLLNYTYVGSGEFTCVRRGTCEPVGGFSVWGSTRNEELPRFTLAERREKKATAAPSRNRRTVAIIVPITSTALFHETVVGANGAASSLVAGLAVAEAITSSKSIQQLLRLSVPLDASKTNGSAAATWEATQVHFLFATADEYGLSGSGRFVSEILTLNCSRTLTANETLRFPIACASPVYTALNFTATDLAEYTHVFALEQLLVGDDVYVHTDEVAGRENVAPRDDLLAESIVTHNASFSFRDSAAQQNAKSFLRDQAGCRLSKAEQLPPNGLFAFFEPAAAKNALLAAATASSGSAGAAAAKAMMPASSFDRRWSGAWSNDTVLVTLSGFDAQYSDPFFQSCGDLPRRFDTPSNRLINTTLISKAATSVVQFLVHLWTRELAEFAASGAAASPTAIPAALLAPGGISVGSANATFVDSMFRCVGGRELAQCMSLQIGALIGTYYASVFQGDSMQKPLPQKIVKAYLTEYLSRLDASSASASPVTSPSSAMCQCNDTFREVCNLDSTKCIRRRAFYVHAFAPMTQYSTGGFWLNTTPSEDMGRWLPRTVYSAPLWTESLWRNLESRIAQQQVYSGGALLGAAIALTVAVALVTLSVSTMLFA